MDAAVLGLWVWHVYLLYGLSPQQLLHVLHYAGHGCVAHSQLRGMLGGASSTSITFPRIL